MKFFNAIVHSRDRRIAFYVILNSLIALMLLSIASVVAVHWAIVLILGVIVIAGASLLLFGFFYAHQPFDDDMDGAPEAEAAIDSSPDIPPRPTQPPVVGGVTPKQAELNRKNKYRTTLSKFARRRIDQQILGYATAPLIFEQRKPAIELFIQLEQRTRTIIPDNRNSKRKPRYKKSPPSTIYSKAFKFLFALALFVFVTYGVSFLPPDRFWDYGWSVVFVFLLIVLYRLILLYHHWERWFFWRLVALDSDKEHGLNALLVIIDKPFLLPAGGVPIIELREITLVSPSTGKTPDDEKEGRSITAGILDYEWIQIDSNAQKDERFNWIGPFRNAPQLMMVLNRARRNARKNDV